MNGGIFNKTKIIFFFLDQKLGDIIFVNKI